MRKVFNCLLIVLTALLIFNIYATDEISKDYELENWKALIGVKKQELAHFKEYANSTYGDIGKVLSTLARTKDDTDLKLSQLRFDLVSAQSKSPYEYRQVLRQIFYVAYKYQKIFNADKDDLAAISNYLELSGEALASLNDLKKVKNIPSDTVPMVDKMITDLKEVQSKFTSYKDSLDAELSKMDSYQGITFNNPSKFNEIVFKQLKAFYIYPNMDLYSRNTWEISRLLRKDWVDGLKLKVVQNFPNTMSEFQSLGLCIFGAIIAYFIVSILLKKISSLSKESLRPFRESAFWFIMAFIFIIYSYSLDFIPKDSIIHSLGILFLIRSMMLLGWGLRTRAFKDIDLKSAPFIPLFWLYFYGVILQFTDQYFVFISILWFIGLVVFYFWTKKRVRKNSLKFERSLQFLSMFLGLIAMLITCIGMVYLSILMMMAWFLICIGIQLARYINYSFHDLAEYIEGNYVIFKVLLIGLSVPVLWLFIMFCIFIWGIGQVFGSYFFVPFVNMNFAIHNYTLNVGNLIFVVYLYFVFKTISHILKITITRLSSTRKIESGAAPSISILVRYALWAIYIVIMLKLIGVDMTSLTVISGGLSVGIGFGLKEILNNFVSGIIILGSHSIKHGDIIEAGGVTGKVIEITIRSTVVKTADNAIVCIPNSTVISDKLINWTNQDLIVRKDITVGISYGTDIQKVRDIVLRIAKEAEYVLNEPEPIMMLEDFADSSITVVLRVWISDIAYALIVMSRIRERIYNEFKANSIEIPFPQLDIHSIPSEQVAVKT
ncbi:MAG TPA: hypothetical protein DD381_10415 [Lentisphaeria bacterium]|nr:MAG: hypothetical protein A2X47_02255 [Lentisphaerae bacterium GWF2_38_69]HBM16739.1 hypothetical protein [Lentisphaeria bacterium]